MAETHYSLTYGRDGRFEFATDPQRVLLMHQTPPGDDDLSSSLSSSLERPLGYPPFEQAVVPGDRVVLAVAEGTPQLDVLLDRIVAVLVGRGVQASDITVLHSPAELPAEAVKSGSLLLRDVTYQPHDASDDACSYLATTANGERVYLNSLLTDADFVVLIGAIAFDPVLGFRGTSSVLYPDMSSEEAMSQFRGVGHDELEPADNRRMRETADEVAWLLGVQFAVQVVPGERSTAGVVLAGQADAVLRQGIEELTQRWQIVTSERTDVVVVAVDEDASGHSWTQVAQAVNLGRKLVQRDGRIIVLSQLSQAPTDGILQIGRARTPREAIQPLQQAAPPDMLPAVQLARGLDWANVYLLSRLPADSVEDLYMVPLANEAEVRRALETTESLALIGGAQFVHARIQQGSASGAVSRGR